MVPPDIEALELEFDSLIDELVSIDDDTDVSDRLREPIEARLDAIRPLLVAVDEDPV